MKVAIIGFGSRGTNYARLFKKYEDVSFDSVCDINREKLSIAGDLCKLTEDKLFESEDAFFAREGFADLCVISTPDNCHHKHAIAAMKAGCDLLLEKPIACTEKDCRDIYDTAKRLNRKVFICHVLRYAPFFKTIKSELDTGKYGKVSTINLTENVCYWHQAHSYVRGNWRNTNESSPMIIAKCCHDLDLLSWYVGEPCESVSSMGSLSFFTRANAPENSADRCLDCPVKDDCEYDAEEFYIKNRWDKGHREWPVGVLAANATREKLYNALKSGPYGRCVFKCDNNAVDHQVVNMLFKGGVTAHLTMTAFSGGGGRRIHVHCERGEIYNLSDENKLYCRIFGKDIKEIDVNKDNENSFGHGGGDYYLIQNVVAAYTGNFDACLTSIENSMQSHFMGFKAEQSRQQGGALIKV